MTSFSSNMARFFFATLLCYGCTKNAVEETYTPQPPVVVPDFLTQINANVVGFVTDENGQALPGASVKAGSTVVTSDAFGYFSIDNESFAKSAGVVTVSKSGYFTGFRSFAPVASKTQFVRIQLLPKTLTGSFGSATGGSVSTNGSASVSIPANAVVDANTLQPYSGTVNVYAQWIAPANGINTTLTMPGDLRGIDTLGHLQLLETYGMMAVELQGSAGEALQLNGQQKATLQFPIPTAIQSTAPASIPLWYFDETLGVWKQEGSATRSGNNYVGQVAHFTFWNCDINLPMVNFSAQILNASLQPVTNTAVTLTWNGGNIPQRTSFTDQEGFVYGQIPAASSFDMSVLTDCQQRIPVKSFQSAYSDVFLGATTVNLQQAEASFTGLVNNCSGSPIANGKLIFTGARFNQVASVQNGMVNFYSLICPGTTAAVIAIDDDAGQQSSPLAVTVSSGINNLGTLQACTPIAAENIAYVLDGSTTTLNLPQHLFNADFLFIDDSTKLAAIDLLNGSITVFRFSFTGSAITGAHLTTARVQIGNSTYQFTAPVNTTITNYGLIGQFIDGYCSGTLVKLSDNTVHTFSCTFHVKRDS